MARRSLTRRTLATGALVLGLAACSGSHRLGAAEPARAPTTSIQPPGLIRTVGAGPEGIVYDAATDELAVAVHTPDRLLLLDPTTLALDRSVALPGSARHLQLAAPGGPVLVPVETSGQLAEVSLPDGGLDLIDVGKQPHDASAAGNATIAVGNEFGHSLSLISNGAVRTTASGVQQPGGVIGDGTRVAVVDVARFRVDLYDTATGNKIGSVPAGAGPTHGVLLDGQRLVVADTRGNAIIVFGLDPLRELFRTALPGSPYGLASDTTTGTVWVTLTALNQVVGLAVGDAAATVVARYPTVRQPNSIAVAAGSTTLWITGTDDAAIERLSR